MTPSNFHSISRPSYKFGLGKRERPELSAEDYDNFDVVPYRYAFVDDEYGSEYWQW